MTTKDKRPIIVLIHGGYHTPAHFDLLLRTIRAEYDVLAPALTTVGWDDRISGKTWRDDVALLHSIIDPLMDQGRQIIILGHSMGGIVITHFSIGESVAERSALGKKGGVAAVFYLTAAVVPAGKSALEMNARPSGPNIHDVDHETKITHLNSAGTQAMYGADIADLYPDPAQKAVGEAKAETLLALCGGQSLVAFAEPMDHDAADVAAPKTYFICLRDEVFPLLAQREMASLCGAQRVVELDAGHSPYLVGHHVETIMREISTAAAVVTTAA